MEYNMMEKFKLGDEGKISDLPKVIRHRVHKDIIELLPGMDEYIEDSTEDNYPGVKSEEWPVTYIYNGEEFVVVIDIMKPDFKTVAKAMAFRFPKDELDKLLE